MTDTKKYWFPAKRYGWGWGAPGTWQGWAVLAVYAVLVLLGILALPPAQSPLVFVAYISLISLLLVAVCWAKGEPPSWRWGAE
jgi:hypothetical protein